MSTLVCPRCGIRKITSGTDLRCPRCGSEMGPTRAVRADPRD